MIEESTLNLIRKGLKLASRSESVIDGIMEGKIVRSVTRGAALADDIIDIAIDIKKMYEEKKE